MKSPRKTLVALCGLLIVSGVLLVWGWRLFWFLTDDAYIAFRYVSNSMFGYGYVWNPPPFQPVEGYTSFLWVVLLDAVWRTLGVPPPESANYLSLLFAFLTLIIAVVMVMRLDWNARLIRFRVVFAGLLALYLVSNRTFLAWTSSGLETALFTSLVMVWFYCCNFQKRSQFLWPFSMALSAALISLARPDGILYVAVTILIVGYLIFKDRGSERRLYVLSASPLLLTIAHLLWRHSFYGEWLPNTYYAKSVGMWPESSWRYALSFVLEYSLWFWALIVLWAVWKRVASRPRHGGNRPARQTATDSSARLLRQERHAIVFVSSGLVLLNAAYYTLALGGDHFEFRIYNQLLPLIFVAFVWSLNSLRCRAPLALGLSAAFLVLSLPVPWTHWALTHGLNKRAETYMMCAPIAPHWPRALRWYAHQFDGLQS
jgi:arabinofuranosyltransferase